MGLSGETVHSDLHKSDGIKSRLWWLKNKVFTVVLLYCCTAVLCTVNSVLLYCVLCSLLYRCTAVPSIVMYCCTVVLLYCVLRSLLSPAAQLIWHSLHKPVTVSRKVEGELAIQSDTGHDWQAFCCHCIMAWDGSRVVPAAGSRAAGASVEPAAAEA